jgi:enterochelin esterase family protein
MNIKPINILFAVLLTGQISFGQSTPSAVTEDFKPSPVNQPGKIFPQVNSEKRVRTQISAPEAKKVQLDIGGVKYDMIKDAQGVWTGESAPQDEGFTTINSISTGLRCPIPAAAIFMVQAAGGAVSRFPLLIRIFTP